MPKTAVALLRVICLGFFTGPFVHNVHLKSNFSLRACAAAALKDVAVYFTKEQGQVAVSKRTAETVPLIAFTVWTLTTHIHTNVFICHTYSL